MKTIAIGDTHGRNIWKEIVNQDFDKVIFVGDYFDTHDNITTIVQLANFQDIIDYKVNSGKEVVLLIGNHDYHYGLGYSERYSGYQERLAFTISLLLRENLEHLKMAHIHDDIMFTHAGVSTVWLEDNKLEQGEFLDEKINTLFEFKPDCFKFEGYDLYGNDVTQSPIWIRPESLFKCSIDMPQVFGHTQIRELKPYKFDNNKKEFWDIDTLGTSKEYIIIEDGVIKIKKL